MNEQMNEQTVTGIGKKYLPLPEGVWAWVETCCFLPGTLGIFFWQSVNPGAPYI